MRRLAITLYLIICSLASQLPAVPAQVMIIRHAEKEPGGNLSQKGLERAGALAPYFELTPALVIFGTPVSIFAARPTPSVSPYGIDESTQRCIQTVGPTAELLTLPIHSGYAKLQENALAAFVLSDPLYDGKNVLICWHHDTISQLAQAFGIASPPVYPGSTFDQTWVITYNPAPMLVILPQNLLFGDTP